MSTAGRARRGAGRGAGGQGRFLERLIGLGNGPDVRMVRAEPPARHVGDGRVVLAGRGEVDFFGCLKGGLMVVVDAKECGDPKRFPVGNRTHVPEHQRECLTGFGRLGALAGLLIHNVGTGDLHWFDWSWLYGCDPSCPWPDIPMVGTSARPVDWWRVANVSRKCRRPEASRGPVG